MKPADPIVDFSRRYHFSASHRLHSDAFSEEQNERTYGKCNNPYGHGHNYVLEITIRGPIDPQTGMVVNLFELDAQVQNLVISRFELQNLNCDREFLTIVPSTENLCLLSWKLLRDASFGSGWLERLRIEETENNYFEFSGSNARKKP